MFCVIMVPVGALVQMDSKLYHENTIRESTSFKERAKPPALEEEIVKEHLQDP